MMAMGEAASAHHAQDNPFGQSALRPDRLPGLAAVLDAFAVALASEAGKLLRGPLTCLVKGLDSVRLLEALSASEGLPVAVLFSPEINAQLYMIFDGHFGWMMIDACFFDASPSVADEERRRPQAKLTSAGARFVGEVARMSSAALAMAFSKITPVSFELQHIEAAGETPLLDRHDASMLAARLAVKTAIGETRLILLLPQAALGRLRHELSEASPTETTINDPTWSREFASALSMATVEVTAVMEELQLTLGEISNLKVGGVLNLRGSGMGRVRLVCNGRDLFWCRLTQNDERYELEVE
jgi:flagellar motor switch protein FliM